MDLRKQILTKNNCYKAGVKQEVKGVLWHSTGANNPKLSRYVPDDGNLGTNRYNNHWDQPKPGNRNVCVHAFIGKDKNGDVQIYQTLPFDIEAWGSGKGTKGSANKMGYVQFEICEDDLKDPKYFAEVYKLGVEFTAHLAKTYGFKITNTSVLDHHGANKLGIASNHGDVIHWFKLYEKTMDDVRKDAQSLLTEKPVEKPATKPSYPALKYGSKGDDVKTLQSNLIKLGFSPADGKVDGSYGVLTRAAVIKYQKARRLEIDGKAGPQTHASIEKDLKKMSGKEFLARITAAALNVRKGPGVKNPVRTVVRKDEVFTIVDEQDGWGKLKSGAGWISLAYTEKV